MRTVPRLLALLTAVSLVALPAPAPAETVDVLPPGFTVSTSMCVEGAEAPLEERDHSIAWGPGEEGTTQGSLTLFVTNDDPAGRTLERSVPSLGELSSWSLRLSSQMAEPIVTIRTAAHTLTARAVAGWQPEQPGPEPWADVDALALTFEVTDTDGQTTMTGTVADYLETHGDAAATLGLTASNCWSVPPGFEDAMTDGFLHVRSWSWTDQSGPHEYVFEPEPATCAVTTSRPSITSGQEVTVTASTTYGGEPEVGRYLTVIEETGDDGGEQDLLVGTTGGDGSVSFTRQLRYDARYIAQCGVGPTKNAVVKVPVRSKVTFLTNRTSYARGTTIVGTGKVSPDKAGHDVSLWRVRGSGPVRVGRAAIKSDGTYRVTTKADTRGTWKLEVTVPAVANNAKGTSPRRTVTVG